MSASELRNLLERAQREGLGDELLEVTPEQAERLRSATVVHETFVCNISAIEADGRCLVLRG